MNDTNEPPGQSSPSADGKSPPIRLAVFEVAGEQKRHLATVTLKKAEGTAWTLEAAGPSEASVEQLRPFIERFTETRRALTENAAAPSETSPADALADMLTAEGFIAERLPAGDHQISLQIDLKTGKVVGTHATMHALAASDDAIGRKVFEAIAGGLSKFADELADEIDKRLAENDIDGAVNAIKRKADRGVCTEN